VKAGKLGSGAAGMVMGVTLSEGRGPELNRCYGPLGRFALSG
jgi:hypothetical protein